MVVAAGNIGFLKTRLVLENIERDMDSLMARQQRAMVKALYRYGAYARKTAKRSIRKRNKTSEPGHPPSGHGRNPVHYAIRFQVEKENQNVVIGPEKDRVGRILETLEYGGRVPRHRNYRRTLRHVGSSGEIRIGGRVTPSTRRVVDHQGKTQRVTYGFLTTGAQAARANRLNRELFGPTWFKTAHHEARPFMRPANEKTKNHLMPGILEDMIV